MLSIFSRVYWLSVCFLWRNIYLGPFFIVVVIELYKCLSISEFKSLLVSSLANVFSHSVSCLFILFMVSFAVQMLISLTWSPFLKFFYFISIALENWPKKPLVWYLLENALLMFSSRSFMVPYLILRSLSHFEFIFVYGTSMCSNFIDLHVAVQLSQHHLLKRLSGEIC